MITKKEAAIITGYTGFLLGDFSDFHAYAEKVMKTPIFTHQFGNETFMSQLKEKIKPDFLALEVQKDEL